MKFKAKIDWWLSVIFAGFVVANIWAIVAAFTGDIGAIIIAATFTPLNALLIVPLWMKSYYLIENNELHIRSGLIKYPSIDVMRITGIANTRNPISAPALSLRRLEISYKYKNGNFSDKVLIAPEDEEGFISHLKSINKDIEVFEGMKPLTRGTKILLWVCIGSIAITLVGVGALFIIGEREPVVTIDSDSVRISAMYGTSVALDNISDITLLNQSMRDIGAGVRTNGYNGGAWRGHFSAGLLFVRPNVAPTIRIERVLGNDIFISFRDSASTEMLYISLAALLQNQLLPAES